MRLRDAIKEMEQGAENLKASGHDNSMHRQLAAWLKELEARRRMTKQFREIVDMSKQCAKPIWEVLAELGDVK